MKIIKGKLLALVLGLSVIVTALPVSAAEVDTSGNQEMQEESGIIDTTPPVLKSLKFVQNEKGYMEYVATATDDLSGVAGVEFRFEEVIWYGYTRTVSEENGVFTVVGDIVCAGICNDREKDLHLRHIYVRDWAGNGTQCEEPFSDEIETSVHVVDQSGNGWRSSAGENDQETKEDDQKESLDDNVQTETDDLGIESITLDNREIKVPGNIGVSVKMHGENASDDAEYDRYYMHFESVDGAFCAISIDKNDGALPVIYFNQYAKTNSYVLDQIVKINENSGGIIYYSKNVAEETIGEDGYVYKPLPDRFKNIEFKVINDSEQSYMTTALWKDSFTDDIKAAPNDAVISVDISAGDYIIPKEALEAIAGTDKTLLLNSDAIQWVIKGRNLTGNLRDLNLEGHTGYAKDSYYAGEEYQKIEKIVGSDKSFAVFSLMEKGDLPGELLVRCVNLSHYSLKELIKGSVNVYRYEEDTDTLALFKENVPVTNGNNVELNITKGGIFVLSPDKLNISGIPGTSDKPGTTDPSNKSDQGNSSDAADVSKQPSVLDEKIPEGPSTWKDKEGTEGFVYRLYNVALTRDAEQAGLSDWNSKLSGKTQTAAEVAQGIFFSAEFQNKNYSDVQYVKFLYRTMFGREADEAGLKGWLNKLDSGMSREYVFHGFAESQEFTNLCNSYNIERGTVALGQYRDKNEGATGYVARLYTRMLGRKYEDDGIEYWCREYLTGKVTIENIATNGFLHSQEFKNLNLSNEDFVTRMYETFLNREPDEAGYKDWVGKLNSGEKTRDDLVYGFSLSQEFANLKKSYGL